ncbi:MAG: DUF4846 domain-containing protein [Polyangiaceae bacterium]
MTSPRSGAGARAAFLGVLGVFCVACPAVDGARTVAPSDASTVTAKPDSVGSAAMPAKVAPTPHTASAPSAPSPPPSVPSTRASGVVDVGPHPWSFAASAERLDARFAPPAGFTRVAVSDGSFGAFARSLPMAAEGARVVDYRGTPLYDDGRHEGIAGVVDIDVGTKDLQQCADAVLRLDAEWRYGRGVRDVHYKTASGLTLRYTKYLEGERPVANGALLSLKDVAPKKADDHAAFRAFLDGVFAWANTASVEREGTKVPWLELRPGDFFVMPGSPFGHAVMVLDLARRADGTPALLLGQSYMPAQSVHVLRSSKETPWFVVERGATEVKTPFWAPFPLETLRRLP